MTDSFAPPLRRLALPMMMAATIGLSACDTNETADAEVTPPATAVAAAPAGAVGLTNCPTPAEGKVHFKVADATLAIPGGLVQDAIPAGMKPPVTKEKVVAEVTSRTAQGQGCPGTPLPTGLLILKDAPANPLLDGSIGLLALPPGGITRQFASETTRLRDKPTKACQPIAETDLLGCAGTERRGGTTTEVLYVISTDRKQVMASGGPLAARCIREGETIVGCNLVDEMDGGIAIDAGLKSGRYTSATLRQALDAAKARVNALRI